MCCKIGDGAWDMALGFKYPNCFLQFAVLREEEQGQRTEVKRSQGVLYSLQIYTTGTLAANSAYLRLHLHHSQSSPKRRIERTKQVKAQTLKSLTRSGPRAQTSQPPACRRPGIVHSRRDCVGPKLLLLATLHSLCCRRPAFRPSQVTSAECRGRRQKSRPWAAGLIQFCNGEEELASLQPSIASQFEFDLTTDADGAYLAPADET